MLAIKFFIRRRLKNPWLIILIIYGITLFYNEIFSYDFNSWNVINCTREETCTKILLVADPQLIGERNEYIHFLSKITIWDSDRYIKKTFLTALKHTNADIVIFLGDLFDEGSIATYIEFQSYVQRFKNIFNNDPNIKPQYIYLPGDNDIGGEGNEKVSFESIYRFQSAFPQHSIITHENMRFIKIDRITRILPRHDESLFGEGLIRILISHLPLLFLPSPFVDQVFETFQPDLLFTAHEHKSMIITTNILLKTDRQIVPITQEENNVHQFTLKLENIYEIIIPTCSYRMGTDKVGYGFAVIEGDDLYYTVLWSPSRFSQLKCYLVITILCISTITIYYIIYLHCRIPFAHFQSSIVTNT